RGGPPRGLAIAGPTPLRRSAPVADAAPTRHRRLLRRRPGARGMIAIRRARAADASAIAAVHVSAWRSTYPGILPDNFLARLSVPRQAAHYDGTIRAGAGVHVATASGLDLGANGGP